MRLCLIGHPVSHSLSPPLHEAAFDFLGISGTYTLCDLESPELQSFIDGLAESGLSGFNVTIPHKESIYKLIANRSPEASLLKAVNTVRVDSEGKLWAHNTDLGGFVMALKQCCRQSPAENDQAVLLGAGGSARACAAGLAFAGFSKVVLAARNTAEAEILCSELSSSLTSFLSRPVIIQAIPFDKIASARGSQLLVNCTSIGLRSDDQLPSWAEEVFQGLADAAFFFDVVYHKDRSPTLLMNLARQSGVNCSDGFLMLACQAHLAFEFWTGKRPPLETLMSAIKF